MKNKIMTIMLILTMTMTVGCGEKNTEITNEVKPSMKIESAISKNINNTENREGADMVTENDDSAKDTLELEEYEHIFEVKDFDESGELVIFLEDFRVSDVISYYLSDSIDLYIENGKCIGYTKPNVEISVISENDEWYFVNIDGKDRYVKIDDIKAVGFPGTKTEYLNSQNDVQGNRNSMELSAKTDESSQYVASDTELPISEPLKQDAVVEAPVPVQSNKYTPDEAIAVYRSLVEAGGMSWDPSLKNGGSWGTGWIYLEKGQPEWSASADLESFAMGDTVGHPSTKYYLEVTGSDENAVYITEWSN